MSKKFPLFTVYVCINTDLISPFQGVSTDIFVFVVNSNEL